MPSLQFYPISTDIASNDKMKSSQVTTIELLDQPVKGYFPSDVVKGVVHLNLPSPITVQEVKLRLLGASQNPLESFEE
jgi:hypothetical protein